MTTNATPRRKYDSTVARIAGNILSGQRDLLDARMDLQRVNVEAAVRLARWLVAETIRTEPRDEA